jgi:4-amino-4-deoxy-L-arabinose transferase-like glycosyltransferase
MILKRDYAIVIILLLAFALRLRGLADHNIWWDEGLAVWAARLPVECILDWTAHDVHPPLYFMLLRGWWLLVGGGEFVLRFPSALAGTLGVAAIYGLGRAMMGRRGATLAAFLLGISVFSISWSQEMRMYILAATLATGTLWAAFRFWKRASWQVWGAYVFTCTAGLWTLYLTISVPIIANIGFLIVYLKRGHSKSLLARWVTAQIAVFALYLPWLIYALPRIPTWSTSENFSPLFFVHLYATMLAVGISVNLETYTLLTGLVFAVLALTMIVLWRAMRSVEQRAGIIMLAVGMILPAAIVYAVSLPLHAFYAPRLAPRYLLPLAACFYALLGLGLAALARRHRWLAVVGLTAVVAIALSGLVDYYPDRLRRDDLVSLAATLKAYVRSEDAVVLHSDKDWPLFAAQYDGEWRGVPNGAPVDASGALTLLTELWEESEGVWLVTTPDAQRVDPQAAVRNQLESNAVASRQWDFGDNALAFFARTRERAAALYDLGPGAVIPSKPFIEYSPTATLAGAWVPLPRYAIGDVVRLVLFWVRPPSEEIVVEISGPFKQNFFASPPSRARIGLTRQLLDLTLRPNWPGGDYSLSMRDANNRLVEIGRFTLLNRTALDTVAVTDIAQPLDVRFGPSIRLVGYNLPGTTAEPGDAVELTLYWQTEIALDARYKVFTHLVGENFNASSGNFLWGQQDNEPQDGMMPTTSWPPGVIIADDYSVQASPDAPSGLYKLEVGLYGIVDGVRLPILDANDKPVDDSITLAEVKIVAKTQ